MHKTIGCFLGWVAGSLSIGVVVGSFVWFVGSIFGAGWDYFPYIQNWVWGVLIFDAVIRVASYLENL